MISNSPKNALIQFKDKLNMLDEGSNMENRFVITFRLEKLIVAFLILDFDT